MVGTMWYGKSSLVGASTGRFLLSVLCCIGLVASPNFTYGQDCSTKIAVPAYIFPSNTSVLNEFKDGASIVIINPNSGPVNATDYRYPLYVNLLNTVKQNSSVTTVLGYVDSNYGIRDARLVLSDIETYQDIYPHIDGIFLDRGSTNCANETILALYKSYDDQVKRNGTFTALNWGTVGTTSQLCYLNQTKINTYVTFEGNYTYYTELSNTDLYPAWMDGIPLAKWYQIVYESPDNQTLVQAAVRRASGLAGYIYFTDAGSNGSNPYGVSPSTTVWGAETSALQNCSPG